MINDFKILNCRQLRINQMMYKSAVISLFYLMRDLLREWRDDYAGNSNRHKSEYLRREGITETGCQLKV